MEMWTILMKVRQILRLIGIIIINLYCIPTYLIWMWIIFLPFRLINHPAYWYTEGVLYNLLHGMVASWSWTAQYYLMEVGDDITSCIDERCLLLVNHQSTSDVPVLMQAFHEKGPVLQSLMWIMDRMFRYTNFGAVSVTHGDYFITQGKQVREAQTQKLINHLLNIYLLRNFQWIVLFPEGGFLSKRREVSSKYAKKNNFPDLQRVTLPRVGAVQVIMDTLHPNSLKDNLKSNTALPLVEYLQKTENSIEDLSPLKWIIDVTIAYPNGEKPLDLLTICTASRPPCTTYLHYRKYPISDVPLGSEEELRDWVYDRWVEKENMLNAFYRTGIFPCAPCNNYDAGCKNISEHKTNLVRMNNLWIGFLHIFFLSSSFLHCYMVRRLWSFIF